MNYNEETNDIQQQMLDEMPDSYSKVKGNWLWEMFKAFAIKIHELLLLLTDTADKLNVEKLQGDELDAYVKQWTDLVRKTASRASGYIEVSGDGTIYNGTIVSNGMCQYEVLEDATVTSGHNASVPVVATGTGDAYNTDANTVTQIVTSNVNVDAITNPEPIGGGADEETDDALRERYYLRLQMPATSGNKAHYILWALECPGVGGAKATRDKSINNKVNLYICNDEGGTADQATIRLVQNHIDPNKNGDGSGCAPVGAICEVFGAKVVSLTIKGTVEIDNTSDFEDIRESIRAALNRYLTQINFKRTELSYAQLLSHALACEGVVDITDFTVNGGYENIKCDEMEIFTLGTYTMEAGS